MRIFELARSDAIVTLAVVVSLPVSSAAEAGFSEDFFVDLAVLTQGNFIVELVDLGGELWFDGVGKALLPQWIRGLHAGSVPCIYPKLYRNSGDSSTWGSSLSCAGPPARLSGLHHFGLKSDIEGRQAQT